MRKDFYTERPVRKQQGGFSSFFSSRDVIFLSLSVEDELEDKGIERWLDRSPYVASERPENSDLQNEFENTAAPFTGTQPSRLEQNQEDDSLMREELSVATDNHDLAANKDPQGKNVLEPTNQESEQSPVAPSVTPDSNSNSTTTTSLPAEQEAEAANQQADTSAQLQGDTAAGDTTNGDDLSGESLEGGLQQDEASEEAISDQALPHVDNASLILEINQEPLPETEEITTSPQEQEAALTERRGVFQDHVGNVRSSINQKTSAEKEALSSHFEAQKAIVIAENAASRQTITTNITTARTELEATYESTLTRLHAHLDLTLQNVDVKKEEKLAALAETISNKKEAFTEYIQEKEAEPESFATEEGNRIQAELTAAADLCTSQSIRVASRHSTNEEKEAALEVGRTSSNDIRAKIEPMKQNVMELALELKGNFSEYRERILAELDRTEEQLRPLIESKAEETKIKLQGDFTTLSESLNQAKTSDLNMLDQMLEQSLASLDSVKNATVTNLETSKEQGVTNLDSMSSILLQSVDNIQQDTLNSLGGSGNVYMPGINALFADATMRLSQLESEGSSQLSEHGNSIREGMSTSVQTYSEQSTAEQDTVTESATRVSTGAVERTESAFTTFTENSQSQLDTLETTTQELIDNGMSEVDTSIDRIKETIDAQNTETKEKIQERTTENIQRAKMPLLDDNENRSEAAAARAGQERSWWQTGVVGAVVGVLASIARLVAIFIVIVIVAALIVAALGVLGLTVGIWTVIAAIGIGLLILMAVMSYDRRSTEGHTGIGLALLVVADTIGITDIWEGITDRSITDFNQRLNQSSFERGDRTTTGVFTLVMTFLAVRGGIRFMRTRTPVVPTEPTTGIGRGLRSITNAISRIGEFAEGVGRGTRALGVRIGRAIGDLISPRETPAPVENPSAGDQTTGDGTTRGSEEETRRQREEERQRQEREAAEHPIQAGDEVIVDDPSRLGFTEPEMHGGEASWNLVDHQTGAQFTEYVHATETTGPDMFLRPKNARIPGVGVVKLIARGFSWTVEALRLNIEAYVRVFGRRPPNLNGQLAEGNMANFQREFVNARRANPGISDQEAANLAIREISFGTHRIAAGYGELNVSIESTATMEFDGIPEEGVPTWVEIEALPSSEGGPQGAD